MIDCNKLKKQDLIVEPFVKTFESFPEPFENILSRIKTTSEEIQNDIYADILINDRLKKSELILRKSIFRIFNFYVHLRSFLDKKIIISYNTVTLVVNSSHFCEQIQFVGRKFIKKLEWKP